MPTNFYMWFIAALIPLVVGAVYYHEKVFGSAWMRTNGFKASDLEGGNMALILGLSYFFGVMIAAVLTGMVIHQTNVFQMMLPDVLEPGNPAQEQFTNLMAQYGDRYTSPGHGFLHGGILALFFVMPIIAINALFERRGWKYVAIHTGYWFIALGAMGALLCATIEYPPLPLS